MSKRAIRATGEKRINILSRTAKEVRNYRVRMKLLTLLLIMLVTFTGVIYIAAVLYERSGSFTVSVGKYEMFDYGLSLSESKDMTRPTSNLNAQITEKMTNISGDTIPENVHMIDGAHNGRDYIAYTFYVQNAASAEKNVEVSYDYEIKMSGISNGLDEAIRLRLYVDDEEPVTYAKTKSDGSGAEPGTTEFASASVMARGRIDNFKPGDKTKYTVVIWIEGNDPECIDWLIGGKMKIEMNISIVH